MTALKDRLKQLIATAGPITVAEYMAACLFDPDAGYYTTREPFGTAGDFTTAPEISQMFGELVGVWAYTAWVSAGKPVPFTFAEIGPGRGTLMVDMLRTIDKLDPKFIALARIALVEASPRLTDMQKQKLANGGRAKPCWYGHVSELPDGALFVVANELFDALPVRQFVKTESGWRERDHALDDQGELCFAAGLTGIDPALLPDPNAETGAIFEIAPARSALMEEISARIASAGGAGLFIDYGHLESGFADTLQAMKAHAYDDVFANPGEADLTSHVDFAVLAQCAKTHGLAASMTTQGDFLLRMGLAERAGTLGRDAGQDAQTRLRGEVERLASTDAMGTLFKVLAISTPGIQLAGFETAA
jgi:SAM-dependent MidA family methyltransferase